jgi:ubiquinone biosynthesis accessory factor UbiJ
MKSPDPADAPAQLANRILNDEAWAREKLAPFAGRVFTLSVGPLVTRFVITADGKLERAPATAQADLGLVVSPLSIPSFLANPARWNEFVREEGDAAMGGALKELARTLPWFVEAALAKGLGPLAGQRVADAGRLLLAFPEYAVDRVTEGIASYARDESDLLARGGQMREMRDGIGDVAARVDALEQRFEVLSARIANGKPTRL